MTFLAGQEAVRPCSDGAEASLRDGQDPLAAALGASDMIVRCLSYLDSRDLANVALTSRAYGGGVQRPSTSADAVPPLPFVEKAAMQIYAEETTADERAVLPRYEDESWLGLLHDLEIHRGRLVFHRLIGSGTGASYVDGNRAHLASAGRRGNSICTAVCNEVMRAGRHFATVEVFSGSLLRFGVIRPIEHLDGSLMAAMVTFTPYNEYWHSELLSGRTERWGSGDVHCCMYCHDGDCDWTDWGDAIMQSLSDWEGAEPYYGRVKVGLLLDLTEGTLTAYKNGERLGVMKNGLTGTYSWSIQVGARQEVAILRRPDLAGIRS
ncbi:hypothetical protein THAOC_23069 [Thalassiosira oceanica]|uniref:B30.2/SPRY domain-containing protein n=1 Tax=Thalassiosira oceanica TaxID=159749 RepID=K0S7R2_THAOC|nr:hypothetical protein THAOC_23069 [Thalassiosira oceanica]|eukprot:EJK56946.1 hypothetical protein THAOC_23069 [Thalassiosira oceanica]